MAARIREKTTRRGPAGRDRGARMALCGLAMALAGCLRPPGADFPDRMRSDSSYTALPSGPQRVDALFLRAREAAGSNAGALRFLGRIAVYHGGHLRHMFDTGLTPSGPLAGNDKTDHFFASAMWQYDDAHRLLPIAGTAACIWEWLDEIRSWFIDRPGYDYTDIWANRLGRSFGELLHQRRHLPDAGILPSDIIRQRERYRPEQVPAR